MGRLTTRMRNWLQATGAHIGTATSDGLPTVVVADQARVEDGDIVRFALSEPQRRQIQGNLAQNPRVAFGPGGLGSIRAAYQFKGIGRLDGEDLVVEVDEVYCTKPGPEAGLRLDTLPEAAVVKFEETICG